MKKVESFKSAAKAFLSKEKSGKFIVIIGIIGIALIFISSLTPSAVGSKNKPSASADDYSSEEYCDMLENRLAKIVADLTGSQNVSVMITLKTTTEYIYASDIKADSDKTVDGAGSGGATEKQKDSTEQNYITVEDENGNKVALLVTSIAPTVQGVVVVCDGGDSEAIGEKVSRAVETVLGISSRKVCVAGRN